MVASRSILVALALLAAACRTATPADPGGAAGPPTALAESPRRIEPAPGGASSAPPASGGTSTRATTGTTTRPPGSDGDGTPPEPARRFETIAAIDDPRGDAGLEAPDHADIVGARIRDDGRSARVVVELGGIVPDPMREGEQMAVGIDFFRGDDAEHDYEIFASGSEDGWLAFFETPDGFVQFPGTFELGNTTMAFTVPWSSFDDLRRGRFSLFVDWDRDRPVVNEVADDRAPDSGTRSFRRS